MMRHLLTDSIGDFSAIYDDDVELISVARPAPRAHPGNVVQLVPAHRDVSDHWTQRPGDDEATDRLSASFDAKTLPALSADIAAATEVLGDLLGCSEVGIRITTLRRPMCPRFHVDQVPCRMLITFRGPGTEWIAHDDVDTAQLRDRRSDYVPVQAGRTTKQLATGSWSLLKGGAWDERFHGVVHRSPHYPGERLLVSLDPMFTAPPKEKKE